jgi:hypothetical protein
LSTTSLPGLHASPRAKSWRRCGRSPTNSKAASIDAGYVEKLEARFPGRVFPPVPATHSIRDFLLNEFDGALLPPAQRYCRTIVRQIAELLDAAAEQTSEIEKVA